MKLNSIKTYMAGILISGLTSCEKPVLKTTARPLLTKKTMEMIDSFAKESKKLLDNTEYKCYAVDTVPINFYMTSSNFEKRLNKRAINATPQIKLGTKEEKKLKLMGKVLYWDTEIVDIKMPKFTNQKAVIDNSQYYSYSWHEVARVPVKYYGKPNPNLK